MGSQELEVRMFSKCRREKRGVVSNEQGNGTCIRNLVAEKDH